MAFAEALFGGWVEDISHMFAWQVSLTRLPITLHNRRPGFRPGRLQLGQTSI